jgi:uncharacterized heparinase superfamily protein
MLLRYEVRITHGWRYNYHYTTKTYHVRAAEQADAEVKAAMLAANQMQLHGKNYVAWVKSVDQEEN